MPYSLAMDRIALHGGWADGAGAIAHMKGVGDRIVVDGKTYERKRDAQNAAYINSAQGEPIYVRIA